MRPHHGVVIVSSVVSTAACTVAIAIYASTGSGLSLFLAICIAVGTVISWASVIGARAMIASAESDGHGSSVRLTGRVLNPYPRPAPKARPLAQGGWSWVGGARVPASLGWLNASKGLAVFELVPPRATLRVRGGRFFGADPVQVVPTVGVRCFPAHGRLPGTGGVAIHKATSAPAYFWTTATVEILEALEWTGYRVSWDEQRPAWW
jgi:hypothetical protein